MSASRTSLSASDRPLSALTPSPDRSVSETVVYRTISITTLPEPIGKASEITAPLDLIPLSGESPPVVRAVAEGVMLTHEQGWRMQGLALGRLVHSLALAPGEVTQLATRQWNRTTRGEASEQAAEQEDAETSEDRNRDIHAVARGVASETQSGQSSFDMSSDQVYSGGGFLGLSAAASINSGAATAVSYTTGTRHVGAASMQNVHQLTQQHAANVRGRRAALVQELSESDTERSRRGSSPITATCTLSTCFILRRFRCSR
jgi:hypothetical protein